MANNNLFTLGLNVSATKSQMDKQLRQIAKELSDGKTVQVTGGLNLAKSQKLIQSQLNTISKNLKVGVQIDTTSIKQQTDAVNKQLSSGINTTGVKVPFQFDLSDANAVKQEINKIVAEITNNQGKLVRYKINVDENQDLAMEYNVMSIPTLLVFKGGQLVKRSVGVISKNDIKELVLV